MKDVKKEDEVYCPKCEKVLKKDMKACPFCGVDLRKKEPEK